MEPSGGRDRAALSERLRSEAWRFDFFQAVRLLERMAQERPREDPAEARYPVGEDHWPSQEAVRFRALPSHGFPTGAIQRIVVPPAGAGQIGGEQPPVPQMIATFLGLIGPSGVLPQHYTSLVIERVRAKDYALRDFLDLFHHRSISLFYRVWQKYRFPVAYERSQLTTGGREEDLFTQCLYSLVGMGTGGLRRRMEFDDEALLYYTGHFARYPRSALCLEMIVSDYFALSVEVRQFQGQWLYLSREDQSSLPGAELPGDLNNALGLDVVVGQQVWDVQGRFRLRLGPLRYAEFRRFLPSGDGLLPLCQLVRTYVGPQFDFDVQPVLLASEVPFCRLGGDGADPPRLGWNTWIRSGSFDHDVDDAVFFLEGLPWSQSA